LMRLNSGEAEVNMSSVAVNQSEVKYEIGF